MTNPFAIAPAPTVRAAIYPAGEVQIESPGTKAARKAWETRRANEAAIYGEANV